MSWTKLVHEARQGNAGKGNSTDQRKRTSDGGIITATAAEHALRLIAERLGVETVNAGQYEKERLVLIGRAKDEWEREDLQEALPSADRLQTAFKGWDGVCKAAGLGKPARTKVSRSQKPRGRGAYTLEACRRAVLDGIQWGPQNGFPNFTQNAYQAYASGRDGVPAYSTLCELLKDFDQGTFGQFRDAMLKERAAQLGN